MRGSFNDYNFYQLKKEQTEKNDSGLTFGDFWALQRRLTLTGDPLQAGRQNVATIKHCITNLVKSYLVLSFQRHCNKYLQNAVESCRVGFVHVMIDNPAGVITS